MGYPFPVTQHGAASLIITRALSSDPHQQNCVCPGAQHVSVAQRMFRGMHLPPPAPWRNLFYQLFEFRRPRRPGNPHYMKTLTRPWQLLKLFVTDSLCSLAEMQRAPLPPQPPGGSSRLSFVFCQFGYFAKRTSFIALWTFVKPFRNGRNTSSWQIWRFYPRVATITSKEHLASRILNNIKL